MENAYLLINYVFVFLSVYRLSWWQNRKMCSRRSRTESGRFKTSNIQQNSEKWVKNVQYLMNNEWMRHLYSVLLCIVVHPKRFTIIWGGLFSTTTSVQHPLGWCDGSHSTTAPVRSPHTSYRWRGERVIEPIKWMGIIRRPWLTRASGGNLARTPGLHPYSFTMSVMGFLMTTESQDLGLTSHPKDGALLTV